METKYADTLAKPVFFVGFMGSGKSSVAAAVASAAGLPLADLDARIVDRTGRPITQIFAEDGEEAFRNLEAAELATLAQGPPVIVACGGGIVERPGNIELMRRSGYVVCLDVDFDEAAKRIGADPDRPLFANREQARALAKAREALYHAAAHARFDTNGRSVAEVAEMVRKTLVDEGILSL